ncbi:S1C family serine protease [Usitatibacter palustris]|uniref:Serine endoprotease DegS n=1 Tax=Usitatibacter palustris TaxID=2732487 RepID=A0A6M4HCH1_9PROT|nr:S1C family serine protease [Usitatibacter palustris]QJR16214.1 Serine endoprotease DegS [Usitatibacter palustris]
MKLPALFLCIGVALPAFGAVSQAPADKPKEEDAAYQTLISAANAVVAVKMKALANARSAETLGNERLGSGVLIAPSGLVLTIGYLILEADQVDVTTVGGRTIPATVVAYDHATGFGLLRPIGPLDVKPVRLGNSGKVDALDRMMVATGSGELGVSVTTVVSKRTFAGYWEYLIDDALFTSPPRLDHSGAALINKDGELVGIGSLFVMDAQTPGERLPGNMFVPVDLLKPIIDEMIETGRQKAGVRPWLGINSLEEDGRIKVLRVTSDGPAEKAGIKPGDIILTVGGQKVEKLDDFYKKLWSSGKPGVEVALKILQGAEVRDLKIRSIDRLEFVRKKPTI